MEILTFGNWEPEDDNPTLIIDLENGIFEVSGRSLPDEKWKGYFEFQDKIVQHLTQVKAFELSFKLEYFNTWSSKCLLDLLEALEKALNTIEVPFTINWYYHADDSDMLEAGQEFHALVDLPIHFVVW